MDGRVTVPITNLSSVAVELSQGEIVAKAEIVDRCTEAGNALEWCDFGTFSRVCCAQESMRTIDRQEEIAGACSRNAGNLGESEKQQLSKLISEFEGIFALSDQELTQTDLVTLYVDTKTAPPVKARMRPVPYAFREKVATMLQDYLSRGIIRPSWSPYASPIILVPKKDGTIRFCTDYRGLNAVSKRRIFSS